MMKNKYDILGILKNLLIIMAIVAIFLVGIYYFQHYQDNESYITPTTPLPQPIWQRITNILNFSNLF